MTPIKPFKKLSQLIQPARMYTRFLVLALRSRRGFNLLLAIIRLLGAAAIFVYLVKYLDELEQAPGLDQLGILILPAVYSVFAVVTLVLARARRRISQVTSFQVACILIDAFVICAAVYFSASHSSELFLLLLLPLVTAAHFLSRGAATLFIMFIMALYAAALLLIPVPAEPVTLRELFFTWSSRALFLAVSSWLYRVQRSLPSAEETWVISPKAARQKIEEMLKELQLSVPYDSISLQLLYKERLVIVACLGFKNPDEVYRIEFPKDDPQFPNQKVISTRSTFTTDTEAYPVFQDPAYRGDQIKTWMGIPLVSPSTDELLGLLSIDSKKRNAFTERDAKKCEWDARRISSFLIEAVLGPAALTQATRRDAFERSVMIWEKGLVEDPASYTDDIQAAAGIVRVGKKAFMVEDCSLYLLRQMNPAERGRSRRVLHLVASSAIPPQEFIKYESQVSNKPRTGLTGYAAFSKKTLNLSAIEIQNSEYFSGEYKKNLEYLESRRTKQILVTPIRDRNRKVIGVLKLENKIGVPSNTRFTILEQRMFEIFVHTAGLMIDGIRQGNYSMRQQQALHNVRGPLSDAVIKPLDALRHIHVSQHAVEPTPIDTIRKGCSYVATVIDNILFDPAANLHLENAGLIPALSNYRALLDGFPPYRAACKRIRFLPTTRDTLPAPVRVAFYNIGREALLNAIRHAKVEDKEDGFINVEFLLEERPEGTTYLLRIDDNGLGFVFEEKRKEPTSFGMTDIFHQKAILEGLGAWAEVSVDSSPGQGTKLCVTWRPDHKELP